MPLNLETLVQEWNKSKAHRPSIRGFRTITNSFLKRMPEVSSVLEFGIAGGGAHRHWYNAGVDTIGGIEIFHPDTYPKDSTYDFWMKSWNHLTTSTIPDDKRDAYKFLHGVSSYDPEAPAKLHEIAKVDKWDLIVDDGYNGCNDQVNAIPIWKDHLNPDGVFITFTPNGYGCDEQRKSSWSDHINVFRELAAQGMMIFDCTPWCDWEHEGYASIAQGRWMGVYTPNMDRYRDIYLEYEQHIVEGSAFLE